MIKRDFKIFLILFLVGNFSFINNSLNIASPSWYRIYGWDSEQLVLDGILNSDKKEVFKTSFLGEFTRPNLEKGSSFSRQYFKEKNKEGKFIRYTSQYGLQVKIFSFLNNLGFPITWLRSFNSFLLSFILSSSYLILRKSNFNQLGSISFTLAFLLSPWIIVSSANLYWVPFTWYLPIFFNSILISSNIIYKKTYKYLLFFILFFAFIIKFLCGFEYITSILIFTIISSIFIGLKRGIYKKIFMKNIFIILIAFSFSFIFSIYLTSSNLNKAGYDGYQLIKFTALKRVSLQKKDEVFSNYCNSKNNQLSFDNCIKSLKDTSDTLKANRILVTLKYFFIKEFLPWIHSDFSGLASTDKSIIREIIQDKSTLKELIQDKSFIKEFIKSIHNLKIYLFRLLNLVCLPCLLLLILLISENKVNTLIILGLALSSPLSWFLIANGHSAGHFHINYTLMYMGFIPITIYLLTTTIQKKFKLSSVLNKPLQE